MRPIEQAFPDILAHEGVWEGEYRHLDAGGALIDRHASRIRCEFPPEGPFAYIQHNHFEWADGRVFEASLPGRLEGSRLIWDVPSFQGEAWSAGRGLILLHVIRKDDPGVHFDELIVANADGTERARTWHWFRHGRFFKRTLCTERKCVE